MYEILFFAFPNKSKSVLTSIRYVLGDRFGSYYLIIGVLILSISIYMAFSKYGDIVLGGQDEKPKYSFFTWGAMMFTCGLAADILFYSFAEWVLYATDPHVKSRLNSGVGGGISAVSLEPHTMGHFTLC